MSDGRRPVTIVIDDLKAARGSSRSLSKLRLAVTQAIDKLSALDQRTGKTETDLPYSSPTRQDTGEGSETNEEP